MEARKEDGAVVACVPHLLGCAVSEVMLISYKGVMLFLLFTNTNLTIYGHEYMIKLRLSLHSPTTNTRNNC